MIIDRYVLMESQIAHDLRDAKLMYKSGVIALIEIIPIEDKFVLSLIERNGEQFHLRTQRGNTRYFKSLDSIYGVIKSLGLNNIKLNVVVKEK